MSEYLNTPAQLQAKAAEKLGTMSEGTYQSYFAKAQEAAKKYGIKRPLLGIDIKFKPGAHEFLTEYTYPISAQEWDEFLADAKTKCEYMPNVYLVDGEKYCLPI